MGGECAGLLLPGETALIAAAVLASQGHLSLPAVIAVATTAAILGDNVSYVIGRRGGRWLLLRPGRFYDHRVRFVERGERFFARHGGKTVFIGRWFAALRITAAWLAGIHHMPWRRFLLWNALGAAGWATSVGLAAYFLGDLIVRVSRDAGLAAVVLVLLAAAGLLSWRLLLRRRR